jgi:hypothetical protein
MAVAVRFDAAFDLGQLSVLQQLCPAAQIKRHLGFARRQFEPQDCHVPTL